jgi:hypothetical protein
LENGLVTFFDVTQCGLYRLKDRKQQWEEGGFVETLSSIYTWLEGRDVDQTLPWDPNSHENRPKIYCKSLHKDSENGDYFFVFWKQFGEGSGAINGIFPKSKVNDDNQDTHKVNANIKGQELILGQAMYYWFIPEFNLIASIRFPGSCADTDAIQFYIRKLITLRVSHPRKKCSESTTHNPLKNKDITTKRISYEPEEGKYSLSYLFDVEMKELSIKNTKIETLAENITHIVTRETISATRETNRPTAFKLFDKFLQHQNGPLTRKKQVEVTTEVDLSPVEVTNILKEYSSTPLKEEEWDNIGFKSNGIESSTKWFNKYIDREHIAVNPKSKKDDIYYTAPYIYALLKKERSSLLAFNSSDMKVGGEQ